jgi:hypothetical protein
MFGNLRKITIFLLQVAFISFLFHSCYLNYSNLKPASGRTNEILIVTNSDDDWKGEIGDTIKDFFGQELQAMPQSEKAYDMIHIQASDFTKIHQTHHNIFILDIQPGFSKPIVETKKDLWAKPQRVIKITVPDKKSFYEEFDKNKESLIELFNENERWRASAVFASVEDEKIKKQLLEKYDFSLVVPTTFYIATTTNNFVWLRREADKYSQGIFIYFYPYTDTIAFNPKRIISLRDSLTKIYIPGPTTGSYMKTSNIVPPVSKQINFNGNFAVEMRGLWELEGDYMGGPFISYTFLDSPHNRIITLDGYVYFPNQDKRNLLLQVESILYTFQFQEQVNAEENKK